MLILLPLLVSIHCVSGGYHFIISMGPSGSGKSKVIDYWNTMEGNVDSKTNYKSIDVDSIVAENEKYILDIRSIMDSLKKDSVAKSDIEDLCKKTTSVYQRYRKEADTISNSRLLELLFSPTSNVFYETTGSTHAHSWLLKVARFAKAANYSVHLVFTYAQLRDCLERTLARAMKSKTRLLCPSDVKTIYEESLANLLKILDVERYLFDTISIVHSLESSLKLFTRIEPSSSLDVKLDGQFEREFQFLCRSKYFENSKLCSKGPVDL